jgi:arabinogalactan endo-1,4-beta-galactosidase
MRYPCRSALARAGAVLFGLLILSPNACSQSPGGEVLPTAPDTTTAPPIVPAGNSITIVGADISSLPSVEAAGAVFSQDGTPDDALAILKRNGFNYARLRLFHAPSEQRELVNDLAYDVALGARAKRAGLKLLLDLHYSDSWADPGKQTKPAAWASLTFAQLKDSVFSYTRDVVAAFVAGGATPDMIQLGNEVNVGILWPEGHADKLDSEWANFAALENAGRDGVRAAMPTSTPLFLHHVADPANVVWHMDNLLRHMDPPDVIGVSYYPVWHGDLTGFSTHMAEIATKYGKPIVIAETAYPWTDASFDSFPDVYHGAPAAGMPTYAPAGQQEFFTRLIAAIKATPGGHGAGFFYWEPAWLPSSTFGSPMDNMTLFTDKGVALPALKTIHDATR